MSNLFTILRGCLLGSVAAWTLIVLGIAIHFQMSFVNSASQLTYVSLAVFVAATTLALFLLLLVAPCNKKVANILRTKWELVWLGVLGILWLSLAGYTTSPAVSQQEVECWDEDEDGEIVDTDVDGYSNDVYHARYRVLQAFAFFNAVLLILLFLFILVLAFWHHKRGRYVIWTTPTTSVGWFDRPGGYPSGKLPSPISFRRKSRKDEVYENLEEDEKKGSKKKYAGFEMVDEKPKYKGEEKSKRTSEDREPLVQKPPAVARSNSTTMKPKQYVVYAPPGETVKPALTPVPPIAAKMSETRQHKTERPQPDRQPSQRELADQIRQQARRDRAEFEEPVIRPVVRHNSSKTPARTERTESKPAVATNTRPTTETKSGDLRRQPTQPAVVRGTGVTRNPSQTRAQPSDNTTNTRPAAARQPTTTQPRTPGRRI